MKKKFIATPLTDEHLKSLEGMNEPEPPPFFYTRLKAKMERHSGQGWALPFRPAWIITTLTLFLVLNGFIVVKQLRTTKEATRETSSLQNFATEYDLSVSTSY